MIRMKSKVIDTIEKYNLIQRGDKIVCGVSGGPDSICMLNILNEIKEKFDFEIYVAHVNHMIREEANEDQKYVQDYCEKKGIQYFVKRIDVKEFATNHKIGTEEAGRNIRYSFFEEVLQNMSCLSI